VTNLDALAAAAQSISAGPPAPAGLPDVSLLTKLANDYFALLPGQSVPVTAGPSLPGGGASPAAASAGANLIELPTASPSLNAPASNQPSLSGTPAAAVSNTPGNSPVAPLPNAPVPAAAVPALDVENSPLAGLSLPTATPSLNAAPTGSGVDFPDHTTIDLSELTKVNAASIAPFPQSLGSTSSQSGSGVTQAATPASSAPASSLPGSNASSIPQPPETQPPQQVLTGDTGLQSSQGFDGYQLTDHIPLPFERELNALLAPLSQTNAVPSAQGLSASPSGSDFYFLNQAFPQAGRTSAVGQHSGHPGQPLPGLGSSPFTSAHPAFDVNAIRRDFPILSETVNGRPLIWFDNAATTQKPKSVIERLTYFYEHENSNIHRAAHELAARATDAYEGARQKVARFLGASTPEDIIFTRGATEAINLVAGTFGQQHVGPGDEIVISNLEHHANVVPWQLLCLAKGAKLRVAPVDDTGALLLEEYAKLLNSRTKIVAFTQVSNALGTITPAKLMTEMAHRVGARVLVDGAQSVSHMKVDVQDIGTDFFVFSGHKLFGPTGIGALYAKKELMDTLPPYQSGGNMIRDVRYERTEIHGSPQRFEAGTGNIADAVGLGAAIDYVERIGIDNIGRYEHGLLEYATHRLLEIPNLRIIGTAPEKASVISLVIKGLPSEEIGARLNKYGIAVRSGHHCAQPILRRFGQETTVRPSFAFYNTCGEIDILVAALKDVQAETGLPRH